jgi:hypothetical protein
MYVHYICDRHFDETFPQLNSLVIVVQFAQARIRRPWSHACLVHKLICIFFWLEFMQKMSQLMQCDEGLIATYTIKTQLNYAWFLST